MAELPLGTRVVVQNLVKRRELNGLSGTIVADDTGGGRCGVELRVAEQLQRLSLKRENLSVVEAAHDSHSHAHAHSHAHSDGECAESSSHHAHSHRESAEDASDADMLTSDADMFTPAADLFNADMFGDLPVSEAHKHRHSHADADIHTHTHDDTHTGAVHEAVEHAHAHPPIPAQVQQTIDRVVYLVDQLREHKAGSEERRSCVAALQEELIKIDGALEAELETVQVKPHSPFCPPPPPPPLFPHVSSPHFGHSAHSPTPRAASAARLL